MSVEVGALLGGVACFATGVLAGVGAAILDALVGRLVGARVGTLVGVPGCALGTHATINQQTIPSPANTNRGFIFSSIGSKSQRRNQSPMQNKAMDSVVA